MEKPIVSEHNLHPIIERRFSPRAFSNKPVPEEKITRMLEAARWTPSANNLQPWRFIVSVKEKDDHFATIFDSLVEFNREWCKPVSVFIVMVVEKKAQNSEKLNSYADYDCGQAAAYITFQSMEEGLWVHQMGGFDKKLLAEKLQLHENYEPFTIIAVGYQGDDDYLPEKIKALGNNPRIRKPLNELILNVNH